MSFTVGLSSDLIPAEAGSSVPVAIEVANRAEEADRFEIVIEGLDPEWTAVPVPSFGVEAGEQQSEKIFLKPPRASESLAGNYPFVVKVRSLVSGDSRSVQGVLQVKAFNHIGMEISPKKGFISPARKDNGFEITLMNLGNTEHTLQMFGSDPEEGCVFSFAHEQVMLQPGQQKTVEVRVTPTSAPVFATSRLYGFTISARSIESPSVVSSGQAQLEQKPLITLSTVAFLAAIVVVLGYWLYLLPKPPTIAVQVDRRNITLGQGIVISWKAQNATSVKVVVNRSTVVADGSDTSGSAPFQPTTPGTYDIESVASRDDKNSVPQHVVVVVVAPAAAPEPEILIAKVSPTNLNVGDHFTITYKFNDAVVRATLEPADRELKLETNAIDMVADRTGVLVYTIDAVNVAGKKVSSKPLRISVTKTSQAKFVKFIANSKPSIDGLDVTIEWQLSNAERAELSDGSSQPIVVDKLGGVRDVPITKTTTFTLTIYDADGITRSQSIKVEVKPQIPDKTNDPMLNPPKTGPDTAGNTTG